MCDEKIPVFVRYRPQSAVLNQCASHHKGFYREGNKVYEGLSVLIDSHQNLRNIHACGFSSPSRELRFPKVVSAIYQELKPQRTRDVKNFEVFDQCSVKIEPDDFVGIGAVDGQSIVLECVVSHIVQLTRPLSFFKKVLQEIPVWIETQQLILVVHKERVICSHLQKARVLEIKISTFIRDSQGFLNSYRSSRFPIQWFFRVVYDGLC